MQKFHWLTLCLQPWELNGQRAADAEQFVLVCISSSSLATLPISHRLGQATRYLGHWWRWFYKDEKTFWDLMIEHIILWMKDNGKLFKLLQWTENKKNWNHLSFQQQCRVYFKENHLKRMYHLRDLQNCRLFSITLLSEQIIANFCMIVSNTWIVTIDPSVLISIK